MLDTEGLESPSIDEALAALIGSRLKTRLSVDNQTGALDYRFVSGSLLGSWDESIAINVKRERWVSEKRDWRIGKCRGKRPQVRTYLESCSPYITIEGSVHKALMGHNVFGGPLCPVAASRWFITEVARRLDVELPDPDLWRFFRIDHAEVYDLYTLGGSIELMDGFTNAVYPRRKPKIHPGESFMFAGQMTTTKGYVKGLEFAKHDGKRLKKVCIQPAEYIERFGRGDNPVCYMEEVKPAIMFDVAALQEIANRYVRFEVEVRSRKLIEEFGEKPTVVQVSREWLETLHDREIARILREGKSGMETVRKAKDVEARLYEVYGHINGRPALLLGVWMQMSALGEARVKRGIAKSTFLRYKQQLQAANVTWLDSDVFIDQTQSLIPPGFMPVRADPRRLTGEALEVVEKLAPFSLAA